MTTDSPGVPYFFILAGVLGAASFWSTASAELAGILLLIAGGVQAFHAVRSGSPLRGEVVSQIPRLPLLLSAVYIASTTVSVVSSGAPLYRYGGLLWHPLLFMAALFVPVNRRGLGIAGMLFLLSGAVAAPVTLIVNLLRDHPGPLAAFTGLTTFADLLALAGSVAFSLLFPAGRPRRPVWLFALPILMIALVLVWSAERAPVFVLALAGGACAGAAGPRWLASSVLIAGVCLLVVPRGLSEKMDWLIRGYPVDRYVVWEEGLKLVPGAPLFGYGPGSYTTVLPPSARGRFINRAPSSWHNDLLETWLDSGPLAAMALGGLLLLGASRGIRGALRRGRGAGELLNREPGLLFLCLASFGLVGSVVTTSVLGLSFWVLLGLTLNRRAGPSRPVAGAPLSS